MAIDPKKYTRAEFAKMVEDAQAEVQELKRVNAALTEQVSRLNGEAMLGRTADEVSRLVSNLRDARIQRLEFGTEVDVVHNHPWRNLWAWFKRKVARHE